MPRYTDESRERVRDAVDFAELVGARTELKRAGVQRLQGLCPFHEERTPSFGIDPTEKVYYCFGCGAGGDVFRFVMETEGLDFGATLESLAERYRVPLERETEDPRDAAKRERRERLYALLERTAAYYVRVLWETPEAAPAREYLASRGLQEDALRAYRVGWAPDAWDRVLNGSRKAGYSDDELLAAGLVQTARGALGADRPLPRPDHVPAGRRARARPRVRRARDEPRPEAEVPEHVRRRALPQGPDRLRRGPRARGRGARRARRAGRGLHRRDRAAPGRRAGGRGADGHRADRRPGRRDRPARSEGAVLPGPGPRGAGVGRARDRGAARLQQGALHPRAWSSGSSACPPAQDPADVVQHSGADEMRALLDAAVPIERFEVERALEQTDAGTDEMLATAARAIAPMPPSVLRQELVRLVADRLGLGEQLVNEALRAPPAAGARPDPDHGGGPPPGGGEFAGGNGWTGGRERGRGWNDREGRGRRDDSRRGGGRDRFRAPAPPPEPADPRAALARREQSERAFLAYCLALPEEGERRLAEVDVDDYFSAPATRQAAAYLRGRLRAPAASLPAGDEALARLVAELWIRSGTLEATLAKLELEALQLELHRLDRHISSARTSGDTSGVGALATERQRVHDEIRHRLDLSRPFPSDTRTNVRVEMDRETLARQLAEGRSIESIARETGYAASTVAYWVNKYGLTSGHAARHAARGGIERETARSTDRRRAVDPGDGGAIGRLVHDRPTLAAPTRDHDAAGAPTRRDRAGPGDRS